MDSDTNIGRRHDDPTQLHALTPGDMVQVIAGAMRGLKGEFVERRAGGRVMLRTGSGMYVEVAEFCVQPFKAGTS